jgi:predicted ribosomally synthesized peptide with nif11-like leader
VSARNEFERFTKDLSTNEALRTAVRAAGTDHAAIVKLANSEGYNFRLADVEVNSEDGELSVSDLEAVAGGMLHGDTGGSHTWVHHAEPAPPLSGGTSSSSTGSSSGGSSGGGGTSTGRPPRYMQ